MITPSCKHVMLSFYADTDICKQLDDLSSYGYQMVSVTEVRRWFRRQWVVICRRPTPPEARKE